ncbi:DExH-box ATP-dependent RNA helicase DExH8 isoform X4 [Magnolia sinica]|uniref:DExH-box ATP-dependent RNA helicase DExH8 isoform X4 n=1 Tax=Magnolia sinica TaxID=86752 RepID=UPI00265B62CE|nr:DExH-box ATP-dependent RNA helicase DExH8 isoform X4 [Magnolia sinica]
MASSPTSSSCSSLSFHSPPNLPVMALRDKIVEKIQGNRVTLIVGDTGCGKSSQVPQFLLEENVEPIVCTQPRRFAVVAIASMVARARNCEVGGEVGFHIGHLKVLTPRSKIVFKTAGVLLDEMLDKGIAALRYKVTELLGKNSESSSDGYCSGLSHCSANADMKPEEHQLIHDLVMHIHESETDVEKSILVFLPTYFSLEQQWTLLKPLAHFKVHILHRSIDTEQALMSMKICKSHRKVILATNIAESSVTIPGVAFVIDSCRSLQVFWDTNRKKDATELVWVSKSQAEQRKGRTGRTCDGQIYRLVTRSFFNSLNEHERPAILNLSLRHQVLTICCAESKAINDPRVLLQKAMDPPDPEVVEDALSLLAHVHALEKTVSHRGRYEPTFYGRLLASLPLSFDASVIVLKFGEIGLLREGILIGTLVDQLPLPILHPFGDQHLYIEYLDKYFEGTAVHGGRKEVALMGNLCAFQFWQRVFKDKHRLEQLKQLVEVHEPKSTTQSVMLKIEQEWCHFHNLVQTSLHRVSEIYEDVLNAMHRFRPKFLAMANGLPSYYDPYEFKHTCLLHSQPSDVDALANDDTGLSPAVTSCVALPFVAPKQFQADAVAENLAAVIKEIRVQFTEDTSLNQNQSSSGLLSHVTDETSLCRFFMNGLCNKGSQCVFSHSLQAKRPICKFFLSFEGCRNGDSCFFSHDCGTTAPIHDSPSYCLPEDEVAEAALLLDLLPTTGDGCILVIDDTNLHFSSNLSHHCNPTSIVATTSKPYSSSDASAMGLTVLSCDPLHSIITNEGEITIPWREVLCALWFAQFTVDDEDFDVQRRLVQKFFEFLAIRILADTLYDVQVIITMNNSRFAQLQVERLGRECFFFLSESFPFDESTFGEFSDRNSTKRPLTVSRPVSYVFNMQPPTDLQFGDYSSALNKCLYNNQ